MPSRVLPFLHVLIGEHVRIKFMEVHEQRVLSTSTIVIRVGKATTVSNNEVD